MFNKVDRSQTGVFYRSSTGSAITNVKNKGVMVICFSDEVVGSYIPNQDFKLYSYGFSSDYNPYNNWVTDMGDWNAAVSANGSPEFTPILFDCDTDQSCEDNWDDNFLRAIRTFVPEPDPLLNNSCIPHGLPEGITRVEVPRRPTLTQIVDAFVVEAEKVGHPPFLVRLVVDDSLKFDNNYGTPYTPLNEVIEPVLVQFRQWLSVRGIYIEENLNQNERWLYHITDNQWKEV